MQVRGKTLQLLASYADEASREAIDMDSLIEELELDSLAMFEVVYELEECFAVELETEELAKLTTVRDLVERIEKKRAVED